MKSSLPSRIYLFALVAIACFLFYHRRINNNNSGPSFNFKNKNTQKFEFLNSIDNTHSLESLPNGLLKPWGISYSPLTSSGSCKHASIINNDLDQISDSLGKDVVVRVYAPDCDILEQLIRHKFTNLVIGLHPYSENENENAVKLPQLLRSLDLQIKEISNIKNSWKYIRMITVGNQGVFNEDYTRVELVKMLKHVRQQLSKKYKKFNGLITTAEPVQSWVSPTKYNAASVEEYKDFKLNDNDPNIYNDDGELIEDTDICGAVDLVGLIVHPYFNDALLPDQAGRLISRDTRFARYLCSDDFIGRAHRQDKMLIEDIDTSSPIPVIVLEAGWPSDGVSNGNAVPGESQQQAALNSIISAKDTLSSNIIPSIIYSFTNEDWHDPGEFDAEHYFGIQHLFNY